MGEKVPALEFEFQAQPLPLIMLRLSHDLAIGKFALDASDDETQVSGQNAEKTNHAQFIRRSMGQRRCVQGEPYTGFPLSNRW